MLPLFYVSYYGKCPAIHITLLCGFFFFKKRGFVKLERKGGRHLSQYCSSLRFSNSWLPTETSLAQLLVWLVEGSLLTHSLNLLSILPMGSSSRTGWVHKQQVQLPDLICQVQTAVRSICGMFSKDADIKRPQNSLYESLVFPQMPRDSTVKLND